jgi:hypothetical protein
VIVRLILGIFDAALIVALYLLGIRAARILTLAEMAADDTDRALGWITEKAAPAIERVAALAPELADVLVTHRAAVADLARPEPPAVTEAEETPVPTQPEIPAQPNRRPRPGPGPQTRPDGLPANRGVKRARLTAATDIDRATAEAAYEHDPDYARMLAETEDHMHNFRRYRDSFEWAKS